MDADQEVNTTRVLVSEIQSLDGTRSRIYVREDGSIELEIQEIVPFSYNNSRRSG